MCRKFCLISVHRARKNSVGVRCVRFQIRTFSLQLTFELALHFASRLRDCGVRKRAKFREKTRECVANFARFRCTAHAKTRRARAACAAQHARREKSLRLSHQCIFFDEISGLRRSKARKISRENARTFGKFCLISARFPCKTRPACIAWAA